MYTGLFSCIQVYLAVPCLIEYSNLIWVVFPGLVDRSLLMTVGLFSGV